MKQETPLYTMRLALYKVDMRRVIKRPLGRALAIFLCLTNIYNTCFAGVNACVQAGTSLGRRAALATTTPFASFFRVIGMGANLRQNGSMQQGLAQAAAQYADCPPGFTDVPGPIYYGPHPSRDVNRAGIWNSVSRAALQYAELKWGATPDQIGGIAMVGRGKVPGTTGEDSGAGGGFPWEGEYGIIFNATVNTNTGNICSSEPLFSFPSIAGTGVAVTLYHNSQTTYNGAMGPGWSCNYDATALYDGNTSTVIVRWGDGTTIPFAYNGSANAYLPPTGIFDSITGSIVIGWTLKKPDGTTYYFAPTIGKLQSITDRFGHVVSVNADASGIHSITAPDGRSVFFDYVGSKIHTIDAPGATWTLNYDNSTGLLQNVQFPHINGNDYFHSFLYDSNNCITQKTDCNGYAWTFTYSASSAFNVPLLVGVTTPLGNHTSFVYTDSACTVTQPKGAIYKYIYNYSGGLLASVVDPNGYSCAIGYGSGNHVSSFTDNRQHTWGFGWSGPNLTSTTSPTTPNAQQTNFTYSSTNDLLSINRPDLGIHMDFTYDAAGNLKTVKDFKQNVVETNLYDITGQLVQTADAYSRATNVTEDSAGNVTQVEDPLHHKHYADYDNMGVPNWVNDDDGQVQTFGKDAWGRIVSVTYPGGAHASVVYDPENQVKELHDEAGNVTKFTYDADGELTSVEDANHNVQCFTYDANGWLYTAKNANLAVRTYAYTRTGEVTDIYVPASPAPMHFTYNANGQTSSYTDPGGLVTGYSYDEVGRQTSIGYSGGGATFNYDLLDNMTSMVDASGTTTISYDNDSNPVTLSTPEGTLSYGYNADGTRSSMNGSGGSSTHYWYDAAGRVIQVDRNYDNLTPMQSTYLDYFENDQLKKITFPNGTKSEYTYDLRGRVSTLAKSYLNGTPFRNETYTFNPESTLKNRVVVTGGISTQTNYTYDAVGQLQSETSPSYSATYTYDANGNRLTRVQNGLSDSYAYDAGDKLLSVSGQAARTYSYDADGRVNSMSVGANVTWFTYGSDGNLSQLSIPSFNPMNFTYNGLGARATRHDSTYGQRNYLRDGITPASDVIADGIAGFTPGTGERGSGNDNRYYNLDGLGNLTEVTNASSQISAVRTWDAFGIQTTGYVAGPLHGYHVDGNYEDDPYSANMGQSALKLLGYRCYDPAIGRFLQPDPAAVGSNWYVYCDNDPIGFADPLGLRPCNMHERDDDAGMGSYNQRDMLDDVVDPEFNKVAGWGDTLSLGATKYGRKYLGEALGIGDGNDAVDYDSFDYKVGIGAGTVHSFAIGAAGGLKALGSSLVSRFAAGEPLAASRLAGLPYKEVARWASLVGAQAHHIIEKRFAQALGLKASEMASVALTNVEHQVFTNRWRSALPYGVKWTKDKVIEKVFEVYHDHPELLKIALRELGK